MATAADLIARSLRLLHQIGSGQDPTSDETTDGLEALNAMMSSWNNEGLLCYARQEESLTLSDGDSSYTIGSGGDLSTTRPVVIEAAWIVDDDVSYPVRIIEEAEYAAIQDKTTESDWPNRILYRPSMATGTILVYPVPNATRTLKLLTRVPIASFSLSTDTVSLPPGWERALAYNLALEIAPEYETEPSQAVINMARESKAGIKRINSRPIKALTELSRMFGRGPTNIVSGS